MKRSSIFSLVFLVFTIAGVLIFSWLQMESEQNKWLATIVSEEDGVTVSVTPVMPLGTEHWEFEVELNTHSGTLPEDLKKQASLIVNNDLTLSPISWEISSDEAHHKEGILSFEGAGTDAKSLELILENLGGAENRSFAWQLK